MSSSVSADRLTFKAFQEINAQRCVEAFHRPAEWSVPLWCLAIAGEAGELCNLVKKIERGDFSYADKRQAILEEIVDVMTYCDLLISVMGADTAAELRKKFNAVSDRRNCGIVLP